MIEIKVITENPLKVLKTMNLATIGKKPKAGESNPVDEYNYFFKCFKAEHSTIETLHFMVSDDHARGDVASQIVRHTKGLPRYAVQSHRPDWNNGEKRKPSDETFGMFESVWNPLAWIYMCRQRLCARAMKESRQWVRDVLQAMKDSKDPFFVALTDCCMPDCIYRGGVCNEIHGCGMCPKYTTIR